MDEVSKRNVAVNHDLVDRNLKFRAAIKVLYSYLGPSYENANKEVVEILGQDLLNSIIKDKK